MRRIEDMTKEEMREALIVARTGLECAYAWTQDILKPAQVLHIKTARDHVSTVLGPHE